MSLNLIKQSMYDLGNSRFQQIINYKYIKRKYNARPLFRDTDSLVDEIETEGNYKDFYKDKNLLYFSDFPRDFVDSVF